MAGNLKMLGKQKRLILTITFKMTPNGPDFILFEKLLLLTTY